MQTQDDITQIVKTINLHLCEVAPKATAKKGEHGQTIYIDIVGVYVAHQAEQAGWRYVENQAAIAAASEMWSDFDNRMQQKEAA